MPLRQNPLRHRCLRTECRKPNTVTADQLVKYIRFSAKHQQFNPLDIVWNYGLVTVRNMHSNLSERNTMLMLDLNRKLQGKNDDNCIRLSDWKCLFFNLFTFMFILDSMTTSKWINCMENSLTLKSNIHLIEFVNGRTLIAPNSDKRLDSTGLVLMAYHINVRAS